MHQIEKGWLPRVAVEVQAADGMVEIIHTGEAQFSRDLALAVAENMITKLAGTITWVGVARCQ